MATSPQKAIHAALAANLLIAVTKFVAAQLSGSSAMLAEGIHSLADTSNELLLLYGRRRALLPPDEQFPFGHGKEVYFWSFVVAILVFAVGAGSSIYQGIDHLMAPHPIRHSSVNYVVLALAAVFEGGSWYVSLREFSRTKGKRGYFAAVHRAKDPSIFVVLLEDSAALLGLGTALAGIVLSHLTGNSMYDASASVIIGLILGVTASILAAETKSLLIGESANREVVEGIREIVRSAEGIKHLNEILTLHMGPEFILVNLSVEFDDSASADDIEAIVAGIDTRIKRAYPHVKRIFVEAEARRAKVKASDIP
ncbi:cation diffusion facilitator family transporter [Geobacter hydrogenophilus]|uniref:Cation transporter n=1 Tax=Geobacter hydrogenophilus TaxID=40983 RepID=A0A9W6FX44_9BACT|nr:cation diffusion facilitator family transporter [Geobacter hydrogenophilus]MBT0895403.1 cation diffusion facilitator family transporter [Geobacter hydrogenophilus]GLI36516.1 cation transporter [Geobacter hydrogenophilus]